MRKLPQRNSERPKEKQKGRGVKIENIPNTH